MERPKDPPAWSVDELHLAAEGGSPLSRQRTLIARCAPATLRHTRPPHAFLAQVRPGDIVVAATDGLFDNVYPDEAASLVSASKVRLRGVSA